MQRDQAERDEVGFDLVVREQFFGAEVAFRDRDHTEAIARPVRGPVLQARPLPLAEHRPAEDRLRRTLGVRMDALGVAIHERHSPSARIEWDLVVGERVAPGSSSDTPRESAAWRRAASIGSPTISKEPWASTSLCR